MHRKPCRESHRAPQLNPLDTGQASASLCAQKGQDRSDHITATSPPLTLKGKAAGLFWLGHQNTPVWKPLGYIIRKTDTMEKPKCLIRRFASRKLQKQFGLRSVEKPENRLLRETTNQCSSSRPPRHSPVLPLSCPTHPHFGLPVLPR